MKKILSLGIASAVLALTAVSASAGVVVKTTDEVKNGSTIKVTFVTDTEIPAFGGVSFNVNASGAKYESYELGSGVMGTFNPENNNKFGATSMAAIPANTVLLTVTYTVNAAEGTVVSIGATNLDGVPGTVQALTETVKPTSTTTDPGTTTPGTSDPTPSTPSNPSNPSTPSNSSTPNGGDKVPDTGVALAVFPAVIAGAAVVVAKKKRG